MKRIVLIALVLCFGMNIHAQLKLSKVTISARSENDMLKGMDFDYFNGLMPTENGFNYRSEQFQDDQIESMHCDNSGTNIEFTLVDPKMEWLEWRIGTQYTTNKIDAISYHNTMDEYMGNYVTFNSSFDEIGINSAVVARLPLKFLNVYFGVGGNVSKSFNNEICVFGSTELTAADISFSNVTEVRRDVMDESYAFPSNCFDSPSHIGAHIYFITGGSVVILNHLELGMELYAGPGFRSAFQSDLNATGLIGLDLRASILF